MFRFPEDRVYFIAEVGPSHDGDVENALRMVERIAQSGADAVKFQTYATASNVVADEAPLAEYMEGKGEYRGQIDLLEQVRLSFDDFRRIANACAECGITFASTPFDLPSVDFLQELGVDFIKVPSGEITNPFLLRAVAETHLPLVVSTGMSETSEIEAALALIGCVWRQSGVTAEASPDIVLLHCTSAYPAPYEAANLRAMATIAAKFGVPVGYSDHSIGSAVPVAATALGARVIEKHVTPDPTLPGPDHAASLSLDELPKLIAEIRAAGLALGDGAKRLQPAEDGVKRVARRSLAAARSIAVGEAFEREALCALRPEGGLSPMAVDRLVGRTARRGYAAGEIIGADELEN